jgi:hypothetical protein
MNRGSDRLVPALRRTLAGGAAALALCGCLGTPDIEGNSDALVVTEAGTVNYAAEQSPERAAAIAEMRAAAAAGELRPYPDAFQSAQTARLVARPEPHSVQRAEAIEAELEAIARRQAAAIDPAEIAALKARAEELRRLAAAAQRG